MCTHRTLFGLACRAAAFSFLVAGTATLLPAQQTSSVAPAPLFVASAYANPFASLASSSSSSSSSDSDSATTSDSSASAVRLDFSASQPPPRRRYGNPNYSDSHSNSDGSPKWTFLVGGGFTLPVGDTHYYETPSWGFQVGGGRNFSKTIGVLLQFDYDHFGLQGATLSNQTYVYDYGCPSGTVSAGTCGVTNLDGNNHVWSFTLDPTFTIPTEGSLGAYAVVGAGFYHKVTDFTVPAVGEYCDYIYGCYEYQANQTIDDYTSNAAGINAGLGVTWKFSKFASEKLYAEARYVVIFNQQRTGITASNIGTSFGASYTGYDFYPANSNRTTYIPVKFGLRF